MGKEVIRRPTEKTMAMKHTRTRDALSPKQHHAVFANWASNSVPESVEDIKENGRILVIVREKSVDTTLMCMGYKKEGNKIMDLAKKLVIRGYIRDGCLISNVLILGPTMWVSVDLSTATFNSNDYIMIVLGNMEKMAKECGKARKNGVKKAIKKAEKKYKRSED